MKSIPVGCELLWLEGFPLPWVYTHQHPSCLPSNPGYTLMQLMKLFRVTFNDSNLLSIYYLLPPPHAMHHIRLTPLTFTQAHKLIILH